MADCEKLAGCPVWARFKSDIKTIWIRNYCQGDKQDRCARKLLARSGVPVPSNLLPNNTTLNE
jgi:hypothetical protein